MKKILKKTAKGFTLVELIVVMIILAILASLLVPSLTGYIDKAQGQAVLVEGRGVYTAAQAALSEYYALHPKYKTSFAMNDAKGKIYGRVTNNMLQRTQSQTPNITQQQQVDYAIAYQVLEYLDSSKADVSKGVATYKFTSSYNPQGMTIENYESQKGTPGILICYNNKGKVVFVEFGRDGYLAHIENGNTYTEKNGKFSSIPA